MITKEALFKKEKLVDRHTLIEEISAALEKADDYFLSNVYNSLCHNDLTFITYLGEKEPFLLDSDAHAINATIDHHPLKFWLNRLDKEADVSVWHDSKTGLFGFTGGETKKYSKLIDALNDAVAMHLTD
jgi:hypothetical protein